MELLIVIAIIAILAAIAIPTFSAQLTKANTAVDAANLRSATTLAVTAYMLDDISGAQLYTALLGEGASMIISDVANFNAKPATAYPSKALPEANFIQVTITDGEVTLSEWDTI
jgi:type IV pilus assembly protein PilA